MQCDGRTYARRLQYDAVLRQDRRSRRKDRILDRTRGSDRIGRESWGNGVALEILPEAEAVVSEYDATERHLDEWELEAALKKVFDAVPSDSLTMPQRRGAWADMEGLRFQRPMTDKRWPWGIYWGAVASGTTAGGTEVFFPDANFVADDILDHWKQRASQSRHPALRARFADLAWEIGRYRKTQARRTDARPGTMQIETDLPVSLAHAAIDSLLELVERGWLRDEFEGWQLLSRALELSLEVGDLPRAGRAKAALFAYKQRVALDALPSAWWHFDEIVWRHRKRLQLSDPEMAEVLGLLEQVVAAKSSRTEPARFDPHDVMAATQRLVRWTPQTDRERVQTLIRRGGNAFEDAAQSASALLAASWLEDLLPIYREAGLLQEAARVERNIAARASEAHGELKRIEVPIEIPREEFDAWVENTAGDTLSEGLRRIAARSLIKERSTKDGIRNMTRDAPLAATLPHSVLGPDGFTVATVGSVQNDIEGRALQHAADIFNWHAPWLNAALLRLRQKHSLDIELLVGAFEGSPLFPEFRLPLLREGLAAWLADDPVKAIHVLVPQVEAAVRELVSALGASVRRFKPEIRGFQVVGLNDLLRDKVMEQGVLGEIRFHLVALYADPRGINLRNIIAHGLGAADFVGPGSTGLANWVIHSLLLLGALRLAEAPRPN
jgi:hypothetical protein